MNENKLSDAVINALSVLKRVHRLSGTVAILHGELVHADVSLKTFSSDLFTTAVQSIFDGFSQRKRRAERVALIFAGQNVVLIGRGPMIVGFLFENTAKLETVEPGIHQFIEQFGTALRMDEPAPESELLEEVELETKSRSKLKLKVKPGTKPEALQTTIKTAVAPLKNTEVDDEPIVEEPVETTSAPPSPNAAVLHKILPPALVATRSAEEILAGIPDRRIRRMIESELNHSA